MQKHLSTRKKLKSWQKRNTSTFQFIDLFAGIGGFRIAGESLGGDCVFTSEWDKDSQLTYAENFGEIPKGDITLINENSIPKHNILCAGFPCQAFSISGKRNGFKDTRGTLFFDIARIAKEKKPEVLFLENVRNLLKHDNGRTIEVIKKTLDDIGYISFVQTLRSSDYGVPQARERVYIIAFRKDLNVDKFDFPKPLKEVRVVNDILEQEYSSYKYINRPDIRFTKEDNSIIDPRKPLQIGFINKGGQGERIYSVHGAGVTLSAYGGGPASKTGAFLINGKIRKLTPRECSRLQGFPEDFKIPTNPNLAYKQFGNSVSVPVIKEIFKQIIKTYPYLTKNEPK